MCCCSLQFSFQFWAFFRRSTYLRRFVRPLPMSSDIKRIKWQTSEMACNMFDVRIRPPLGTLHSWRRDLSCNLMAFAVCFSAAVFSPIHFIDKEIPAFLFSLSLSLSLCSRLGFWHRDTPFIYSLNASDEHIFHHWMVPQRKAKKRLKEISHSLAFNENPISVIMEVCSATENTHRRVVFTKSNSWPISFSFLLFSSSFSLTLVIASHIHRIFCFFVLSVE